MPAPDFKEIRSNFPTTVWDGTSQTRTVEEAIERNPADSFDRAQMVVEIIALQKEVKNIGGGGGSFPAGEGFVYNDGVDEIRVTAGTGLSVVMEEVINVDKGTDAVIAHVADSDPHEQYILEDEIAALIAAKADLFSPSLTGTPTAPTATSGTNTTQIATTAFVKTAVDTLDATVTSELAAKASTNSPAFSGTPTAPTATSGTNTTQIATTAFVKTAVDTLDSDVTSRLAAKAPLASPALTGTPTAPTAIGGTNTTQVATTAFVKGSVDTLDASVTSALALKAPLASPALTGTPTAPTATSIDDSTKIATTAFVQAVVSAAVSGLLELKGDQDCSANPNYPVGSAGDTYYVTVAGKIGGASGKSVDINDAIVCKNNNAGGTEASVGTSWFVLEHNLIGALLTANNLSDVTNASTARTNLGLSIGTNVQAFSTELTTLAGITPTNNDIIQRKSGAWANRTIAQLLVDLAAAGTTFQPLDIDLTTIAALAPATNDTIQFKSGAWANRTIAQLLVDLAAAGTTFQPLDTDLTQIAAIVSSNDDIIQKKSGAWANRTIAQLLVDLATPGTTFQPLNTKLTTIAGLTPTNDDILQYKAGAWANRTIAQLLVDLGLSRASVIQGGRLTFLSGSPYPVADLTAQSTLYYTPTELDRVFTSDGTLLTERTFSELSLALSGLTSGSLYDTFIYYTTGNTFAVRGTGTGTTGVSTTSFTANLPTSISGDLLLMFVMIDDGTGGSVPTLSGWTQIGTTLFDAASNAGFSTWRKISAGETTVACTGISNGSTMRTVAYAVQGAAFDVVASQNGSTLTTTLTVPSVTTTLSNDILFTAAFSRANGVWSMPAGQTTTTAAVGGVTEPLTVGYEQLSASGATGTRVATFGASSYLMGFNVALKQSAPAGVYLELGNAWTNSTTRSQSLTRLLGHLVKSADTTRLYVGTIKTTGTNTGEDSIANRNLFDFYRPESRFTSNASRLSYLGYVTTNENPVLTNADITATSDTGLNLSNDVFQDITGLTVTLPAAGTYFIFGQIRVAINNSTAGAFIRLQLNLNGSLVTNTEMLSNVTPVGATSYIMTFPIFGIVTASGAHTLKIQGSRNGSGVWVLSDIQTNGNGRTKFGYLRIG